MLYMCWILYVTTLSQNLVDTVKYQGQYDSKIYGSILSLLRVVQKEGGRGDARPLPPPFPVAIFFQVNIFRCE